jgi:DNA repair exonuclease SbcCD ATPase subunit
MHTLRCGLAASRRLFGFIPAALLLVVVVAGHPVHAQTERSTGTDAITPVEEFSRQIEQLKKTFGDLNQKIDDSAKSIDRSADVERARKEIEGLRAVVSTLLSAVADNGEIAQIGAKAHDRTQQKLKALEQDTRFKASEKDFLVDQWRKLNDETEQAITELSGARKEFTELLRTLQTNEDFIDELVQIRQAKKAIEVIRQLTKDIRDASDQLKKLIGGIKPPGA